MPYEYAWIRNSPRTSKPTANSSRPARRNDVPPVVPVPPPVDVAAAVKNARKKDAEHFLSAITVNASHRCIQHTDANQAVFTRYGAFDDNVGLFIEIIKLNLERGRLEGLDCIIRELKAPTGPPASSSMARGGAAATVAAPNNAPSLLEGARFAQGGPGPDPRTAGFNPQNMPQGPGYHDGYGGGYGGNNQGAQGWMPQNGWQNPQRGSSSVRHIAMTATPSHLLFSVPRHPPVVEIDLVCKSVSLLRPA
ncbi:hypothetical protein MRB53_039447 [Persea americana]|nr:hypothetical protein MRB53_039447 [Persea americana]